MARASSGRTAPPACAPQSLARPAHAARPTPARGRWHPHPSAHDGQPPARAGGVRARREPHPSLELRDMAIFPVRTISLMP